MTAVLSPIDPLRRDRIMSLDDNQISYSASSTDWRAKYNEVADMLAETRAELDDFHHASKELEAELENELQRTEKAQQDLKVKVARAETERDEWKSKFMSLQTTHNTTTTSLQRELDKLRQEHQQTKVQLRELEMGNDDLERNERAVSSSLADIEAKYSRALEEKILLEHELLDKASLEEECQRLKDELRDANVEISILKDQIAAHSNASTTTDTTSSHAPSSLFPHLSIHSDDDLLNTPPPPDLQLSELATSSENIPAIHTTPRATSLHHGGQSALLQRAGFQPNKPNLSTPPSASSGISRSSTLPSLYSPSHASPRTPIPRPAVVRNPSSASTSSAASAVPSTTSKNKGVQMVSEMRARVRNLEQKIHTRVPRLRMGSITGRPNANALAMSTLTSTSSSSSIKSPVVKTNGVDERGTNLSAAQRRSADSQRRSNDSEGEKNKKNPSSDSSGWVLIMEDSPSPPKDRGSDKRRASSPSAPTSFRPAASTSAASPTFGSNKANSLAQSTVNTGIRRPLSRLSGASLSTTATTSSIPTPTSRPATPTFLPIPSGGLYAHASTAGVTGLKRSTGPGAGPYSQTKRSSLGSSTAGPADSPFHRERPVTMPPPPRPGSGTPSASSKYDRNPDGSKALPQLPALHANVTMRPPSKLPASGSSTNSLAQSRIGRPSGGTGGLPGRRSVGDTESTGFLDPKKDGRSRAGSATAAYSKGP